MTHFLFSVDEIGKNVVESAKKLIIEKIRSETKITDGELKDYIQAIDSKIDKKMERMEKYIGKLEDKLEMI